MNAHFQQTPAPPGQWVPGSWGTSGTAMIQQAPATDPSVGSWQSQPGPNPAITGAAWMQHQQGKGQFAMTPQSLASGSPFGASSWEQAPSQGSVDAFSAEYAGKGVSAHHFQSAPPGAWQPEGVPDSHRRRRHRSRSPRRLTGTDVLQALQRGGVSLFREVFHQLPQDFRAVTLEAPPGLVVDTQSITNQEDRMSMCRRLNDLRRERLAPLASPASAPFYQEDGFKCVPMSRQTERHFWDLFHRLPVATTDASRWKAVLKHVDQCPEKPKSTPTSRDVEWASAELQDGHVATVNSPPRTARQQTSSFQALQDLAAGSPLKPGLPLAAEEDYATWVKGRVDVDTANLSLATLELDTKARKFSKKMSADKALKSLPPLEAMGDLFTVVYKIYLRKLEKLCSNLNSRSKEGKALKKLCDDLNVENDSSFPDLVARLRASEIMHKPL